MKIQTKHEQETFVFGENLSRSLQNGDVVCITGDLGTGKTALTKGIAKGLGILDWITSPTFTVVNEYEGDKRLFHFDVYRVHDEEELFHIGFLDYFEREGVFVIEWADLIEALIPKRAIWLQIEKDLEKGLDVRYITVRAMHQSERGQTLVDSLCARYQQEGNRE
jgi:tRNA threonylcarbamoyladenosine biosynthesis protein TsaE